MPKRPTLILLLLAACDSARPTIELQPDATPDSAPDSSTAPNVVSVRTFGDSPLFIMYRDGSGPWQAPVDTGGGYDLLIHDKYELVAVCGAPETGYDTGIEASTYEESGGTTFLPCFNSLADPQPTVAVTGTMKQPGTVAISYSTATSATASWAFELAAESGLADLVAIGSGRMVIRRDLDITAPVVLPSIDVVTEGAAMMPVAFELPGAQPDDIVTARLYLMLGSGFTSFDPTPGATAQVVPPSLLHTNDNQLLSLDAVAGPLIRNAFMFYVDGETPTTITLPPRLTDIQFGPGRASWVTIPDGDVQLYLFSGLTSVHSTATHGWLGTNTELVIDTDIPGFRPEWTAKQVDFQEFDVSYDAADVSLRTAILDTPDVPPSVTRWAARNAHVRKDPRVIRRLRHRGHRAP